jgi:hypothetical protein
MAVRKSRCVERRCLAGFAVVEPQAGNEFCHDPFPPFSIQETIVRQSILLKNKRL